MKNNENSSDKLIVGNIQRDKIDLNRPEAKSTDFIKEIKDSIKVGNIVLDIHSYPPDTETDDWHKYDVVILVVKGVSDIALARKLRKKLGEKYKAKITSASVINYVQEVAKKKKGRPILIEVNEKHGHDELGKIAKIISRVVRKERNPPYEYDETAKRYITFQDMHPLCDYDVIFPVPEGGLSIIDSISETEYLTSKWSDNKKIKERVNKLYYHTFEANNPFLCTDKKGKKFILGKVRVRPEGICDALNPQKKEDLVYITQKYLAELGDLVSITPKKVKKIYFKDNKLATDKGGTYLYIIDMKGAKKVR